MPASKLSSRRLLGGLLTAVAGCLWPRSSRATAPPRRSEATAAPQPGGLLHSTTYSYDRMGRLLSVTEHPPRPIQPSPCIQSTQGQVTSYIYGS